MFFHQGGCGFEFSKYLSCATDLLSQQSVSADLVDQWLNPTIWNKICIFGLDTASCRYLASRFIKPLIGAWFSLHVVTMPVPSMVTRFRMGGKHHSGLKRRPTQVEISDPASVTAPAMFSRAPCWANTCRSHFITTSPVILPRDGSGRKSFTASKCVLKVIFRSMKKTRTPADIPNKGESRRVTEDPDVNLQGFLKAFEQVDKSIWLFQGFPKR